MTSKLLEASPKGANQRRRRSIATVQDLLLYIRERSSSRRHAVYVAVSCTERVVLSLILLNDAPHQVREVRSYFWRVCWCRTCKKRRRRSSGINVFVCILSN